LHQFLQDFRYAVRMLRKNAGLTAVIVLSLAIGIGANTAIFSVVDALLLRPLPYPDPDGLAVLWLRSPGINIPQDWPSPGQYIDIKTQNRSFQEMSISQGRPATLIGPDQPQSVDLLRTSSTLFHMLGAKPLLGRLLLPEEDVPGRPAAAVLSYAIWQRLFNSDPQIVGKSITLAGAAGDGNGENKNQFVVVGVLEREFLLNDEVMPTVASTRRMDIFLPLPLAPDAVNRRGDENYNLMARLKPGVTMQQAQADIGVIAARIREKDKRDRTFTISVVPLLDQVVGNVRRAMLVLLGSVALVLLIACANVANLLLSRAGGRQKEVAIRTALGAGWQRLVRQLLTESILLAIAGGAAGLLIAKWSLYVVRTVNPGNIPRLEAIGIDGSVLAFTFLVSLVTGVVFGLAPALRAVKVDLNTTLKAGGRNTQADGGFRASRHRLRSLLVVAELAFSLMLLIGATLLIRSFIRLQSVSPGFRADHVISMRLGASGQRLTGPASAARWRQLIQSVAAVPGVTAAGAVGSLPFTSAVGWGSINVEGFTPQPGQELQVDMRGATPDYFSTMQIPLRQGRFATAEDAAARPQRSVLIDEKFAQRFWPRDNPIGKQVWFDPKEKMTIVGVVGIVKEYGLDVDGRIVVYFPSSSASYVVARTAGDPSAPAGSIVNAIHAVDPTIPVFDIRTMDDRMYDSMARQRFSTIMLAAFAVFALVLASIGVYGVISYLVTQNTHDLGVRIALGAQQGSIVKLVVWQGMELAVLGIAAGMIGAFLLTRVMASLLFGVSATDAVAFSAVPVTLAAIAALASYVPAVRATRVDPMVALRDE
jgi:putative ABC transport system permease protein